MSDDIPKRWLIDFGYVLYVMDGFSTPEAAIVEWSKTHNASGCPIKISKLGPVREFKVKLTVELEPA